MGAGRGGLAPRTASCWERHCLFAVPDTQEPLGGLPVPERTRRPSWGILGPLLYVLAGLFRGRPCFRLGRPQDDGRGDLRGEGGKSTGFAEKRVASDPSLEGHKKAAKRWYQRVCAVRWGLNPHAREGQRILSPPRLPIPPLRPLARLRGRVHRPAATGSTRSSSERQHPIAEPLIALTDTHPPLRRTCPARASAHGVPR